MSHMPEIAEEFMKANREKRSAIIKKLTSGRDEDARRERRDEAIALVNGIEAFVYQKYGFTKPVFSELLREIGVLRSHLYDRSTSVKMILEHLAIVVPVHLV